ncbi:nicotinate-nucleotide adenylyltransferase [bacterium]|nr:nicotinate-nucleotide adenylyltransferase [candidate division CSSED10-310 bacterium]
MRIGICGGTFDPIHTGHLLVGQEAGERLSLDKVIYIPAKIPPHKLDARITHAEQRLKMIRLAIRGNALFDVDDLEVMRAGPSFTIETLEYLTDRYPGSDLFFLMGQDTFIEIETWHRYADLFDLCRIVVVTRPGTGKINSSQYIDPVRDYLLNATIRLDDPSMAEQNGLASLDWKVCLMTIPALDISASQIRLRVSQNRSIRYLVPELVRKHIEHTGLYQSK